MRPQFNAHLVSTDADGNVVAVEDMSRSDIRINGGFFVFRREILDLIEPGDELVEETFERLIAERELVAYPYDGFFGVMDTIKDRQRLETMHEIGPGAVAAPARRSTASPSELYARAVLNLSAAEPLRRVLAIGCHADDIEIGCGGTLLTLARANPELEVDWVVLAAPGERGDEARASAEAFLAGVATLAGRGARLPRRLPAVRRRRGEGGLRGAEGPRRPAGRVHACRLRLPSGSPARLRADLEHVPQPL